MSVILAIVGLVLVVIGAVAVFVAPEIWPYFTASGIACACVNVALWWR